MPTLLWRMQTERGDGVGANVVLARHDEATARRFLADPEALRTTPPDTGSTPSAQVLETLLARL